MTEFSLRWQDSLEHFYCLVEQIGRRAQLKLQRLLVVWSLTKTHLAIRLWLPHRHHIIVISLDHLIGFGCLPFYVLEGCAILLSILQAILGEEVVAEYNTELVLLDFVEVVHVQLSCIDSLPDGQTKKSCCV